LSAVPHPAASAVAGDPSDAARAFSRAIRFPPRASGR
jgi:hypothetical protein